MIKEVPALRPAPFPQVSDSSVLLPLSGDDFEYVQRIGEQIPDGELVEKGREYFPHCTVMHGLADDAISEVAEVASTFGPVQLNLNAVTVFGATQQKPYDVLKIDVSSPEVMQLNAALATIPHDETYPYNPHVTIAYLKPGRGKPWAKRLGAVNRLVKCDELIFSDGERNQTPFSLQDTLSFADGQPPGQPPRAGLQWKAETHRWIRPDTGEAREHHAPSKMHPNDFTSAKSFSDAVQQNVLVDGLPDRTVEVRKKAVESVVSKLTPQCLGRLSRSLTTIIGHADSKSVTDAWSEGDQKLIDSLDGGKVLGFVNRADGSLHLNGGLAPVSSAVDSLGQHEETTRGIYSHEIGHAIDAEPGGRTGRNRWGLSSSPEFDAAFESEIKGGQLSDYATESPQEGFAEFARLLYGSDIAHDVVEKHFPKTFDFFKSKGLV